MITTENWIRFPGDRSNIDSTENWEPKIKFVDPDDILKLQKLEDRKIRYARRRV